MDTQPFERHPVDRHVGERIKAWRLTRGLSQSGLGEACGITFQQIQKYENASNRVSVSRLWQIARVLNVPLAGFFEGLEQETPPGEPAAAPPYGLARADAAFLRDWQACDSPKVKASIAALLRRVNASAA